MAQTPFTMSTSGVTNVGFDLFVEGHWDVPQFQQHNEVLDFQWDYTIGGGGLHNTSGQSTTPAYPTTSGDYSDTISSLDSDRTVKVRAHSQNSGNAGGFINRKTAALSATWISGPTIGTVTQNTIAVSGSVIPRTVDSTAIAYIRYRVNGTVPWSSTTIATGLSGSSTVGVSGSATSLVGNTTYDIELYLIRTTQGNTTLESTIVQVTTSSGDPTVGVF